MGIKKIDADKCNGCEICIDSCPMDVIHMNENGDLAVVAFPEDCHSCYLCVDDCPAEAIDVSPEQSKPIVLPY